MAGHGKRLRNAYDKIDRARFYALPEAVKILKESAVKKFDETVEVAMNLGIDTRHSDQQVRGVVALPHGTARASASRSSPRARRRTRPRPQAPTSWVRRTWPRRCRRARST